jgi:hypothetical protein
VPSNSQMMRVLDVRSVAPAGVWLAATITFAAVPVHATGRLCV